MAANTALELVDEAGWRAGLATLLRKELHDWWGARKWWMQSLIWLVILNGILALAFWSPDVVAEAAGEGSSERPGDIFAIFAGIFGPMGAIVLAQSRIVGEKQSGTAAWLLAKPLSRTAFLLSKLVADGVGMLITIIGIQGLVAYAQFSAFTGSAFPVLPFLGALGLLALNLLFYLTVTLMLGTWFNGRSVVIGGALALLFIQTQLGQSALAPYTPGALPFMALELLAGAALPTLFPVLATVVLSTVCMAVAIWRFEREEF
jgi:ABC-2 type transport system permease protein